MAHEPNSLTEIELPVLPHEVMTEDVVAFFLHEHETGIDLQATRLVQDVIGPQHELRQPSRTLGTGCGRTDRETSAGSFEALVAEIAARFLRNFDPQRERCWTEATNSSAAELLLK